jgi:hypothetical protein
MVSFTLRTTAGKRVADFTCCGMVNAFPKSTPFLENLISPELKSRKQPITSFMPKASP